VIGASKYSGTTLINLAKTIENALEISRERWRDRKQEAQMGRLSGLMATRAQPDPPHMVALGPRRGIAIGRKSEPMHRTWSSNDRNAPIDFGPPFAGIDVGGAICANL
jgi:hypothetical protein